MNKNNGFTLIELLIGITVSALIFLTAGSMISLLFRTDVKTQRIEDLEQTKNDLLVQLSNSVRWAEVVTFTAGDAGQLTADTDTYSLSEGRILKTGEAITPSNVNVTKFRVSNFSGDPDLKSIEIQINMESANTATSKDSLNIVVSQRKTTIGTEE